MAQKIVKSNEMIAKKIKLRRKELGLTIEEAAARAGVGTKTWSRYEAGESIRLDKTKGICKALNWHNLPTEAEKSFENVNFKEYRKHEAWSDFLKDNFGDGAALSFAIGSDIVFDHIEEDLTELSKLPVGAHMGQLGFSLILDFLPKQFFMHYDYNFLYRMKCALLLLRNRAKAGVTFVANSVIEELLIYLCNEEGTTFLELSGGAEWLPKNKYVDYQAWVFDLFGDEDIIMFLYSDIYVEEGDTYHFSRWFERQFDIGDIVD